LREAGNFTSSLVFSFDSILSIFFLPSSVLAAAGSKDNARRRQISAARAALLKIAQRKFINSKSETRLPVYFQKFLRKISEFSKDAGKSFQPKCWHAAIIGGVPERAKNIETIRKIKR
jgi:hypothetical protein